MRVDQKTKNVYWKALRLFYYSVLCEIAQLNVGALMMLQGVVAANFVERWEAFVMHHRTIGVCGFEGNYTRTSKFSISK